MPKKWVVRGDGFGLKNLLLEIYKCVFFVVERGKSELSVILVNNRAACDPVVHLCIRKSQLNTKGDVVAAKTVVKNSLR